MKRGQDIAVMNSDYEGKLAAEIDRALKALPELQAPPTLVRRVSAALERRRALPWYRLSWQAWPAPVRTAAMVILAAFFATLCFGAWMLPETEGYTLATRQAAGWLSGFATLWNTLAALGGALARVVQGIDRGFLLGCLAALALAWGMCLGLGTACVRLALARR